MNLCIKIRYVVVEEKTKKILYVLTETMSQYDAAAIGEKALQLWKLHKDAYVMVKIS